MLKVMIDKVRVEFLKFPIYFFSGVEKKISLLWLRLAPSVAVNLSPRNVCTICVLFSFTKQRTLEYIKSTGSHFHSKEPLIEVITTQILWHIHDMEQVCEPRLEPVTNGY